MEHCNATNFYDVMFLLVFTVGFLIAMWIYNK